VKIKENKFVMSNFRVDLAKAPTPLPTGFFSKGRVGICPGIDLVFLLKITRRRYHLSKRFFLDIKTSVSYHSLKQIIKTNVLIVTLHDHFSQQFRQDGNPAAPAGSRR
jgi:hypothetical protein